MCYLMFLSNFAERYQFSRYNRLSGNIGEVGRTPTPLGFWTLVHIRCLLQQSWQICENILDNFERNCKRELFYFLQKICLRSDFASLYFLWGNSANGIMPPMPRWRLYQCRFNAKLCRMQDWKHYKVYHLIQSSFPDMKSISFSIIPWHSKNV